jgi:hypothetical protein
MLTGRRAFDGDDVADTLANVLKTEPDWNALPAGVGERIRVLLQRCLERDRGRRVSDASVARFVLSELEPSASVAATTSLLTLRRKLLVSIAAAVLVAGLAVEAARAHALTVLVGVVRGAMSPEQRP